VNMGCGWKKVGLGL